MTHTLIVLSIFPKDYIYLCFLSPTFLLIFPNALNFIFVMVFSNFSIHLDGFSWKSRLEISLNCFSWLVISLKTSQPPSQFVFHLVKFSTEVLDGNCFRENIGMKVTNIRKDFTHLFLFLTRNCWQNLLYILESLLRRVITTQKPRHGKDKTYYFHNVVR